MRLDVQVKTINIFYLIVKEVEKKKDKKRKKEIEKEVWGRTETVTGLT